MCKKFFTTAALAIAFTAGLAVTAFAGSGCGGGYHTTTAETATSQSVAQDAAPQTPKPDKGG